jgi:hypothetical protein
MFGLVPLYSSTPEDMVQGLNVHLTLVGIVPIRALAPWYPVAVISLQGIKLWHDGHSLSF